MSAWQREGTWLGGVILQLFFCSKRAQKHSAPAPATHHTRLLRAWMLPMQGWLSGWVGGSSVKLQAWEQTTHPPTFSLADESKQTKANSSCPNGKKNTQLVCLAAGGYMAGWVVMLSLPEQQQAVHRAMQQPMCTGVSPTSHSLPSPSTRAIRATLAAKGVSLCGGWWGQVPASCGFETPPPALSQTYPHSYAPSTSLELHLCNTAPSRRKHPIPKITHAHQTVPTWGRGVVGASSAW